MHLDLSINFSWFIVIACFSFVFWFLLTLRIVPLKHEMFDILRVPVLGWFIPVNSVMSCITMKTGRSTRSYACIMGCHFTREEWQSHLVKIILGLLRAQWLCSLGNTCAKRKQKSYWGNSLHTNKERATSKPHRRPPVHFLRAMTVFPKIIIYLYFKNNGVSSSSLLLGNLNCTSKHKKARKYQEVLPLGPA